MSAPLPLPLSSLPLLFAAAGLSLTSLPLAKKRHLRGVRARLSASSPDSSPSPCRLCSSHGFIPCTLCDSTGVLSRGGFTRRNPVRIAGLVGSKWTRVSALDGKWRHFLCVAKRGRNVREGIAELTSTCGPQEKRIRIQVPVKELKSREMWEGGWTTLREIWGGIGGTGTTCSACRGEKKVMCPRCDGLGLVGL